MRRSCTAATTSHPGRPEIVAFFTFLPHHDAKITSGFLRATSAASTMRSRPSPAAASSGKIGAPPAISTSSSTQRMPEMIGSSHSSKNTRSRAGNRRGGCANSVEIGLERARQAFGVGLTAHETAEHPNHLQNLADGALIERDDGEAAAYELRREIGLQIGEREHQVRPQRFDLVEPGVDERGDLGLRSRLRRTDRVARHADDAMALAEQVQRFGRLFGQADDAIGISGHQVGSPWLVDWSIGDER